MTDEEIEPGLHKRASWRGPTLIAAAIVAAAALTAGLLRPAPDDGGPISVGERAPIFELEYLDGSGTLSSAELEGSVVVVNFWASWCAPCRREMPMLEEVWRDYRDQDVVMLGVDVRDAPAAAREFVDEVGVTYPVVVDPDATFARALGIDPLPQTFLLDGNYRFLPLGPGDGVGYLGEISEEELRSRIEEALTRR